MEATSLEVAKREEIFAVVMVSSVLVHHRKRFQDSNFRGFKCFWFDFVNTQIVFSINFVAFYQDGVVYSSFVAMIRNL